MFKILHIILISAVSVFGNVQTDKVTFLGVSASTLPERMSEQMNLPTGVYLSVDQVSPESPADSAGLKLFDILLKFDDQILVNSAQLKALVRMKNSGDQVNLEILRKGNPKVLSVILSEIEQPSIPNKPQLYGMRNKDIFTGDPFSSNIDNLIPNLDSSIRDLLESHGVFSSTRNKESWFWVRRIVLCMAQLPTPRLFNLSVFQQSRNRCRHLMNREP